MSHSVIAILVAREDKVLLEKVAKARGEDISSFIRRSYRRELASLSYLSENEKKALGVKTEKQTPAEGL
jgi:hypothetical protein